MARIVGSDGQVAQVDSKNRLQTFSVVQDLAESLNFDGLIYSVQFSVTPVGANDFFFFFKNTGTIDIAINDISISSTVPTKITYEFVSGTPTFVSATDAAVTNRNLGSSSVLLADAKVDTNITALTSEGILAFEEIPVANTRNEFNFKSSIIVPQGKAVAFKRVAATGQLDVLFSAATISL